MVGRERAGLNVARRALLFAGAASLASVAGRAARAIPDPGARFFMLVSGPPDGPAAQSWGALRGELEKRGFP
jgi:hypothetical protein